MPHIPHCNEFLSNLKKKSNAMLPEEMLIESKTPTRTKTLMQYAIEKPVRIPSEILYWDLHYLEDKDDEFRALAQKDPLEAAYEMQQWLLKNHWTKTRNDGVSGHNPKPKDYGLTDWNAVTDRRHFVQTFPHIFKHAVALGKESVL